MQYLLMIYAAEAKEPAPGSPEFMELIQEYGAFTEEVKANGGAFRTCFDRFNGTSS